MLFIDRLSPVPVYEQLIDGVQTHILLGIYPPGSPVPSLRELSATLGINPNTIQKSYAELTRRGILAPSPGNGCYVTPDAPARIREAAAVRLPELTSLASSLALAGVPLEDALEAVRAGYTGEKSPADTDSGQGESHS